MSVIGSVEGSTGEPPADLFSHVVRKAQITIWRTGDDAEARLSQDARTRQPLDHPVRGDQNLALVTGALCVDQRLSDRLYRIDSVNGS